MCLDSHEDELKKRGVPALQIQAALRIAAVVKRRRPRRGGGGLRRILLLLRENVAHEAGRMRG
jgi:hypothetical protein